MASGGNDGWAKNTVCARSAGSSRRIARSRRSTGLGPVEVVCPFPAAGSTSVEQAGRGIADASKEQLSAVRTLRGSLPATAYHAQSVHASLKILAELLE